MSDEERNQNNSQKEEEKSNREEEQNNNENENNEENNENENNEENKEEEKEVLKDPFTYLIQKNEQKYKINENLPFEEIKEKCKYSICILMDNNGITGSNSLSKSLKSIANNIKNIEDENEKLKISKDDIYLFVFIKEMINNNSKIKINENEENKKENEEDNNYYIREWDIDIEELNIKDIKNLKLYTINKLKYLSYKDSFYLYYQIMKQIKSNKKIIFSTIMTSGIIFEEKKLLELMMLSYHDEKKHCISSSFVDYEKNNLISKICSYEKMRFNIYNMNFYIESNSPPINSQLCMMVLNNKLIDKLIEYYKLLNDNITLEYHDYNLSLYLLSNNYLIKHYNDNPGYISNNNSNINYYDYQKMYIDRFSGLYANFFDVLSAFKNIDILKKIFTIFQLISIFFEFILPSIFSMIIYIIFYSAFKSNDYNIALFFTLLYLSLLLILGICSLINNNPNKMNKTYFILNILMIILYFFTLICSIPAMHFANKDSNPDLSGYKFDKAAISTIIIFTFIPYIIPLILNFSLIKDDFFLLIIYNLIWAPLSKINYNIACIWTSVDTIGGNNKKERKSIFILLYLGINLFFGCLGFYNSDNKKKANCVMAFSIIYLFYNFIRSITVIIFYCFRKEEYFINRNILDIIGEDLNAQGNETDLRSENEPINNDNEDNINNDDNNINNGSNDGDGREVEVEE